jgi:hypothetical protein
LFEKSLKKFTFFILRFLPRNFLNPILDPVARLTLEILIPAFFMCFVVFSWSSNRFAFGSNLMLQ